MNKIIAAAAKELLQLRRDRAGLLVLFVMPAILVMVITLVQKNVMDLTGQNKNRILFLDQDGGELGESIRQRLAEGYFEITVWDAGRNSSEDMRAAVTGGEYQAGIVIPDESTVGLEAEVTDLFKKTGAGDEGSLFVQIPVQLFFDPAILPGSRSAVTAQLQAALVTVAMETRIRALDREISGLLSTMTVPADALPLPVTELSERFSRPLFTLKESVSSSRAAGVVAYNPVQQNVPAWALFGMFFTAVPLAGTILQERKSGIWSRLKSMPSSFLLLFSGKVLAYTGICFCQFLLVGAIGLLLFPYLGLPAFTAGQNWAVSVVVVFCASLAACGFGIFLGMACSSYEQASALGSTTVVLASAIGGVMVPVYAMPPLMQKLSVVSPLNWALTAFNDLLVRGYSLSTVQGELACLVLFFLFTLLFAWRLARI